MACWKGKGLGGRGEGGGWGGWECGRERGGPFVLATRSQAVNLVAVFSQNFYIRLNRLKIYLFEIGFVNVKAVVWCQTILWISPSLHCNYYLFQIFFCYYSWFKVHLHVWQSISMKDKGKLVTMRDFDEKIIWTCDSIPLVASYSKGSLSFFFLFLFLMVAVEYIFIFYCFSIRQHATFNMAYSNW